MKPSQAQCIVDVDVLIDFIDTDPSILSLFSRHYGQIYVLEPVLDEEIERLDAAECDRLTIRIAPVETETLLEAGQRGGALSVYDWACLLVAREMGARCITNDPALRRECKSEGIPCIWGLELMVELVHDENLEAAEALRVATAIHEINARYITREVLDRFRERLLETER